MQRTQTVSGLVVRLVILVLVSLLDVGAADDNDTPHCGKRIRIATHFAKPFINIDPSFCINQNCPRDAFGADGGMTYELVTTHVLPLLIQYCKDAGQSEIVELEWYIPNEGRNLASNAVKMVCNGDFTNTDRPENGCVTYNGPSNAGTCDYVADPACVSNGPDMVAGAVHILRERLDMLDFTIPFLNVQQIVVTRPMPFFPDIMSVFKTFTLGLWFIILAEIAVVWVLILYVEAWPNEQIDKLTWFQPFYDSLYWALGSAFDPGGPGKAAVTMSGKIFMMGHWFFLAIIAATYTGAIGPYLAAQEIDMVTGLDSLSSGRYSVVVRGPPWNSEALRPEYLGDWLGGISDTNTSRSTQFKLLQTMMESDSSVSFRSFTTKRMESYYNGQEIIASNDVDPCNIEDAELGAFDMVKCGTDAASLAPDALIFDAPSAYYELNTRKDRLGKCELVTVGSQFSSSSFGFGFPKKSTLSIPFNKAIQTLKSTGKIEDMREKFRIRRADSECSEVFEGGGAEMTIVMLTGLFIFTTAAIIIALCQWGVQKALGIEMPSPPDEEEEAEEEHMAEEDGAVEQEEEMEEEEEEPVPIAHRVQGLFAQTDRIETALKDLQARAKRRRFQPANNQGSGIFDWSTVNGSNQNSFRIL